MISVNAPGDPVERMVVASQDGGETAAQAINQIEQKKIWRKKLGLDLPIFYFSLHFRFRIRSIRSMIKMKEKRLGV